MQANDFVGIRPRCCKTMRLHSSCCISILVSDNPVIILLGKCNDKYLGLAMQEGLTKDYIFSETKCSEKQTENLDFTNKVPLDDLMNAPVVP